MSLKRKAPAAAPSSRPAAQAMSEDDQLALALAMSMEEQGAWAAGLQARGSQSSLRVRVPPMQWLYGSSTADAVLLSTFMCGCAAGPAVGSNGAAGVKTAEASGAGAVDEEDGFDEEQIWEQLRRQESDQKRAKAAEASKQSPEQVRGGQGALEQLPCEKAARAQLPCASLQVTAEASGRLPPEPAEGEAGVVRVALRLPDGSRCQRRFNGTDTVHALHDLVLCTLPEAAAGRKFTISPALPGAPPLSDASAALESAGVAGALLAVKWVDS
jgi:hypothetical protein